MTPRMRKVSLKRREYILRRKRALRITKELEEQLESTEKFLFLLGKRKQSQAPSLSPGQQVAGKERGDVKDTSAK